MIDHESVPLSPEDREELAAAAINADRRNTPVGFLMLGGTVLALGLILVLVSCSSLRGARGDWKNDTARVAKIERLAQEYDTLRTAANDTSNIRAHEPDPTMLSNLQRIATQSGVDTSRIIPKTNYDNPQVPGTRYVSYVYSDVRDESLTDLLGWAHRVIETVPGMRVSLIKIALAANTGNATNSEWEMNVSFTRTELTRSP